MHGDRLCVRLTPCANEIGSKLVLITRRHDNMPAGEAFAQECHSLLTGRALISTTQNGTTRMPGYLRVGSLYKAMVDFMYPIPSLLRFLNLRTCRPV